jgi:monomeric sarcosine oxidase
MGLAAAWALARRGHDVQVLERFGHVHDQGSHGGATRIIRQAYHEGSGYVPLVRAAEAAWEALGARRGETLLVRTGLVEFGPPDAPDLRAALAACRESGVEHEVVAAADARARWPLVVPDDFIACHTPSGGYLRVTPCLDALRDEARARGARFRWGCPVSEIRQRTVQLADGTVLDADLLVICAGAWLPQLLPALLPGRLQVLRRVLLWTDPGPTRALLAALPVWAACLPDAFFYGFPWNAEGPAGFKLACHTAVNVPSVLGLEGLDAPTTPELVRREITEADRRPLLAFLRRYLPGAVGPVVAQSVCLYTTTPSWDFLVDRVVDRPWIVAGGFSGHGFKFAPVIGELVADLAERGESRWQLPSFRLDAHRALAP